MNSIPTPLRRSHPALAALVLAGTLLGWSHPAPAGPLMDRIQAHRAARTGEAAPAATVSHGPQKVLRNVSYGPDANQRMDVYLPPAGQAVQGVIFMVHGGGWKHGDKRHDNVVDEKVARWVPKGLALVSINYRMLPEAPVQTQADDVRQALAHAQRLATQWQVPADRFVLMGHSAGAHLVSLVSANPGLALAQGAQPWLGVVSLDSAAMDVPRVMKQRHMKLYDEAFGTDPAYWQAVSPWHQLTASVPPSLLVCSSERPDHPCQQARDFAAKVRSLGGRSEVHPEALSHGEINARLGLPGPYTEAVERFMAGLHPALAQALRP